MTILRLVLASVLSAISIFAQFVPSNPVKPSYSTVAPSSADALKKYASCYERQNPEIFKTISEAEAIVQRLRSEGFDVRGLWCNTVAQTTVATSFSAHEMVEAGFPKDKPLHLVVQGISNWHRVDQLERWLNSGLWNWGMKLMLRWWW